MPNVTVHGIGPVVGIGVDEAAYPARNARGNVGLRPAVRSNRCTDLRVRRAKTGYRADVSNRPESLT